LPIRAETRKEIEQLREQLSKQQETIEATQKQLAELHAAMKKVSVLQEFGRVCVCVWVSSEWE
jgi:uncharacterized coiled-coil protein SlyX